MTDAAIPRGQGEEAHVAARRGVGQSEHRLTLDGKKNPRQEKSCRGFFVCLVCRWLCHERTNDTEFGEMNRF
jgi:hypothetical protein